MPWEYRSLQAPRTSPSTDRPASEPPADIQSATIAASRTTPRGGSTESRSRSMTLVAMSRASRLEVREASERAHLLGGCINRCGGEFGRRVTIPETGGPVRTVSLRRHKPLPDLALLAEQARSLVPNLVGVSPAALREGLTSPSSPPTKTIAVLDAMQYLDGGHACRRPT